MRSENLAPAKPKLIKASEGAQRSQNGYDNSGQFTNSPGWTGGDTISATERVMDMIAGRYATPAYYDVVVAIELLNEPLMSALPGGVAGTRAYYQNGFSLVRNHGGTSVVIHDGFENANQWNGFLAGKGAAGAIIDHHEYQCFTNAFVALTPQEHVNTVCPNAQAFSEGRDKFLFVGEWSGAMTDCAPGLVSLLPYKELTDSLTIHRTAMASAQDTTEHIPSATRMVLTVAALMLGLAQTMTSLTSGHSR